MTLINLKLGVLHFRQLGTGDENNERGKKTLFLQRANKRTINDKVTPNYKFVC